MGSKLTMLGVLGFLALAGLSFSSVSSSPVVPISLDKKSVDAPNIWVPAPLKVEAVYHEGRVKKFMSYLRKESFVYINGTVLFEVGYSLAGEENDPKSAKYIDFFQRIPPPFLLPSILTATENSTSCQRKGDIWVPLRNEDLFHVWPVNNKVELWTGLLSQCDLTEMPVLVEQRHWKFWYLDTCSSENHQAILPRSVSATNGAIPLYTIFVGPRNPIMILEPPPANFHLPSFLRSFPFDLMNIKYVLIRSALCSAQEKETLNLKKVMKYRNFVLKEVSLDQCCCFIIFSKEDRPSVRVHATATVPDSKRAFSYIGMWRDTRFWLLLGSCFALWIFCFGFCKRFWEKVAEGCVGASGGGGGQSN